MKKTKKLLILIGNIGTGKTTLAREYVKEGYVIIARDGLRYTIGSGTYIFNYDYENVIWKTELYMYTEFLQLGVNIIVDEVGVSKSMRARYMHDAKVCNYEIIAVDMPHLSMKEAVDRRMNDPHQQNDRKLWERIYNKFEDMYEKPIKKEGFDKIIYLK